MDGAKKYDAIGMQTAAVNADNEEYLNIKAINNHTAKAISATGQYVAKIKPKLEATPFPPLKFNHTGKLCPNTPKAPAISDAFTADCPVFPKK